MEAVEQAYKDLLSAASRLVEARDHRDVVELETARAKFHTACDTAVRLLDIAKQNVLNTSWAHAEPAATAVALAPDHELFEAGNVDREVLAAQQGHQHLYQQGFGTATLLPQVDPADSHQCSVCRAVLPTVHLLDVHLTEVHDSFFAAQAARRMPVFQCLVESCQKMFCTAAERQKHLVDAHQYAKSFDFGKMHLRQRKQQQRPLPQYQKRQHKHLAPSRPAGKRMDAVTHSPAPQQQPEQPISHQIKASGAQSGDDMDIEKLL